MSGKQSQSKRNISIDYYLDYFLCLQTKHNEGQSKLNKITYQKVNFQIACLILFFKSFLFEEMKKLFDF